jgi:Mrp family chromosome partitioning ATPase
VAAMRGEGVTYTTLGLAATLASDMNVRVCAVELNWAWPGMTRQQPVTAARRRPWQRKPADTANAELGGGSAGGPGLAAVVSGAAKLDDALLPTSLPNLRILPAGNAPEAQRPALARSEQLTRCLDELSERFDHLLLDIPAIMVTSDSVAIASRCDACCVVVRQSVTRSTAIRQALDEIKHLTVLGVVLNQARFHTPRWLLNAIPQE